MVYIIYVWIVYIKSLHDDLNIFKRKLGKHDHRTYNQGKNKKCFRFSISDSVVQLCPPCLKIGILSKAFYNSFSPRSDSMGPVRVLALAGKVLLVIHGVLHEN